jgi:enamine deaminase RidA (YjgF/YER057c/UK114 family)
VAAEVVGFSWLTGAHEDRTWRASRDCQSSFKGDGNRTKVEGTGVKTMLTPIVPAGLSITPGLSQAMLIKGGSLLVVSGLVSTNAQGAIVGSDIESQLTQIFENMDATLRAAGSNFHSVARLTYYLVDYQTRISRLSARFAIGSSIWRSPPRVRSSASRRWLFQVSSSKWTPSPSRPSGRAGAFES